ncbi:hypothetical protein ACJ41O_000881 [Fusarium nematophilum]
MACPDTPAFNLVLNLSPLRDMTYHIVMDDDIYDYTLLHDDPADLHSRFRDQISTSELEHPGSEGYPGPQRNEALIRKIHGSNMIESAGGGFDITRKLCQLVFDDSSIPDMVQDDPCCLTLKSHREQLGLSSDPGAIFRSRNEIIQHALAARYIFTEILHHGNDLSEEIILETHRILTHRIDAEDIPWTQYSGVYRKWPVSTGFHSYMHHAPSPPRCER